MNLRELVEKREKDILCEAACFSSESKGRQSYEDKCEVRTDFQRDRDRITYSKAFRRLKHKTQVFISPEGDHYRTRLTHTLEVSQIARTIARALRLNEDLTEAVALAHDLGHTPFGHAGERVLNQICPHGFKHNEQSVRVVKFLEKGTGINLTWEVCDGILCHTGSNKASTLEGQIIKYADRIAYINHDIEDAIRGKIISGDSLPKQCVSVLGETSSIRINNMVLDIIQNSTEYDEIKMSLEYTEAMNELRAYMFENVYVGSIAKSEESKAERLLRELYIQLVDSNVRYLPVETAQHIKDSDIHRVVCDYIAGMTDRYAVYVFNNIYVPKSWENSFI